MSELQQLGKVTQPPNTLLNTLNSMQWLRSRFSVSLVSPLWLLLLLFNWINYQFTIEKKSISFEWINSTDYFTNSLGNFQQGEFLFNQLDKDLNSSSAVKGRHRRSDVGVASLPLISKSRRSRSWSFGRSPLLPSASFIKIRCRWIPRRKNSILACSALPGDPRRFSSFLSICLTNHFSSNLEEVKREQKENPSHRVNTFKLEGISFILKIFA